jgi:hypothetical protein
LVRSLQRIAKEEEIFWKVENDHILRHMNHRVYLLAKEACDIEQEKLRKNGDLGIQFLPYKIMWKIEIFCGGISLL